MLAGLPGHSTPAREWLEVVPFLAAYDGAVAKILHVVYGDAGPGNGRRTGDRATVGKASPGSPARPGPDGIVPSSAFAGGTIVDASTLMARAAADERGGRLA